MMGNEDSFAAIKAASISSSEDIVSIHNRSTPPSLNANACLLKASFASFLDSVPNGSNISPVGPIEPAIKICFSNLLDDSLAILAASKFNSSTLLSAL